MDNIQAAYRKQIATHWNIRPGDSLLEVGCGQGDMTVILAEAVGESGKVAAVDAGPRSYGSPQTLGEATDLIKASPLGSRIDFRFEFNLLKADLGEVDAAVLVHSLWYFSSEDLIKQTLARLRDWTDTLYLAEWDLIPDRQDQFPHLLAVFIQGHIAPSTANVRTLISKRRLKELLTEKGWEVRSEDALDTSTLQDADWEIDAGLRSDLSGLPNALRRLVQYQAESLRAIALPSGNCPLPAYALMARRV